MADTQVAGSSVALGPAQIEAKAEAIGQGKASMKLLDAFVLAILAGMFIGTGGMLMLLVKSDSTLSFAASQLLGGLSFSLGLFLVVVAGAELFTGNSLMVCGACSRKYSVGKMLANWGVVYLGNLVGSCLLVVILQLAGFCSMNAGAVGAAAVSTAVAKVSQGWWQIFFRGVMCNILVCLAVWMSFGAKTTPDKFFAVTMPILAFVACGFEHCVANMFFFALGSSTVLLGAIPLSIDAAALNLGSILWNLSASTLGNIVGGALIVGLAYWFVYARKGKAGK